MTDERFGERQIAELRQQHIGRLLLQAQRDYNNRAVLKLHERGHTALTLAHTAFLPHLDLDGTRITVLADRAGMTKQGMGQLVVDLERQGYVTRGGDPSDRRAMLVKFTEREWEFLRDAHAVKLEIESEYSAILGGSMIKQLRATLQTLVTRTHVTE